MKEWRNDLWKIIAETPYLDWIIITKRIGNAKFMLHGNDCVGWTLQKNVWLMITVCNQSEADRDIPKLLELNATVRGLSIEPMLGEIDLSKLDNRLNWVIIGGESGKNARPMHPNWVRKIRDQCVDAGVSLFFKQWGEWKPNSEMTRDEEYSYYEDEKIRIFGFDDKGHDSYKVGKKRAGNLLDGKLWQQMPMVK